MRVKRRELRREREERRQRIMKAKKVEWMRERLSRSIRVYNNIIRLKIIWGKCRREGGGHKRNRNSAFLLCETCVTSFKPHNDHISWVPISSENHG